MSSKHTLMSLCQKYDKIEIPIIQRDYAQGREKEGIVRGRFVEFLIQAFVTQTPVELDFVYGNVREEEDKSIHTFIPVDGQQRLTTLWLLHWFLSVKEGRLREIFSWMNKFSYETRPSSHSFCERLLSESFPSKELMNIREYIINQKWFDNEWLNDGTVSGMLQMLYDFSQQEILLNGTATLNALTEGLFSFYLVPLELFGLSDELYIRMNARGKVLTDFENFKSEFYKILKDYPQLEEVKNKMETKWVENLWPYKKKGTYVIDQCFMNYLKFITRCLYFQQAKPRAESYADDFLDMNLLRTIYSAPSNTDFLQFAFDVIPIVAKHNKDNLLWENKGTSLADLLALSLKGDNMTIDMMVILYSALKYLRFHGDIAELKNFVRVVRNLIYNTNDKSERDQPRILCSVERLSASVNVFETLALEEFKLEGLRESQCREEHFKARLRQHNPKAADTIEQIENNTWLRGNISNLLAGTFVSSAKDIASFELSDEKVASLNLQRLTNLYVHYDRISDNEFSSIWGDLLDSMLYTHYKDSGRMICDIDAFSKNPANAYSKNPAIIDLTATYMDSKKENLETFLIEIEKKTIRRLSKKYNDLGEIRNAKQQLYIYYVLTRRIMGLSVNDFFKNGWRIGWLAKEKGFTSLFHEGIEGDPWFSESGQNPIFQTYSSQFRYSWGLNTEHALPPEIVGGNRPQKAFEKLLEWASS